MTISSGGFNPPTPSFSPTPTIYEQETTGRHDLQNKADIGRGNVVIVPQSSTDEVPLSKLAERNTWNYKSESGRPSLRPAGQLRGNAPELTQKEDPKIAGYTSELTDELPVELQAELKQPTMKETGSLQDVLKLGAQTMAWVDGASTMLASENAQMRAQVNGTLSTAVNQSALNQVNELTESMQNALNEAGPNAPFYQESSGFVADVAFIAQERQGG